MQITKRSLIQDVAAKLSGRVQFEADVVPHLQWERLGAGRVTPVPSVGIVTALRAVKDEQELAAIGRAARVADRAFEALTAETWVGRSEKELGWRLRELLHAHGADDASFEAIVAWGPNGAKPHARPGDTILEPRSLVVVDWGAVVDGYCSDCTRTLSTGSPPERLREAYEVCRLCAAARLRRNPRRNDRCRGRSARARADRRGRIRRRSSATVSATASGSRCTRRRGSRPSRATSSRPGTSSRSNRAIYLEGVGGVRIEDLAVVRDDGVELLTSFPKELIEVS